MRRATSVLPNDDAWYKHKGMRCSPHFSWVSGRKMPKALRMPKNSRLIIWKSVSIRELFSFFKKTKHKTTAQHEPLRLLPAVRLTTEAVPAVMASTWEWISCLDSSTLFWTHTLDACKTRQLHDIIIAQSYPGNQGGRAMKRDQHFVCTLLIGPAPTRSLGHPKPCP